ncbi:ABC transporter permease, partial [Staphylococcus hominis]
ITRGGTRYRNAQEEIKVTSDKKGESSGTWPEAGMYWLETSSEDKKTTLKQAKTRRLNYVATLEVLPL